MGNFSDYTFGKKKNGISFNLDKIKGGIKIDKLSSEKIKLFSDVINENNDGIIDSEEIDKFINKIKLLAQNNNLSMKEAAKLIRDYNLENTTQQDLFNFLEFLSQESENIKESSILTDAQSNKTILITYQDGTNETIYPDKSSQINTTGDNGEEIVRNYNADRTINREVVTYTDKSVKTTNFKNNLPEFSTFEKDGTITEINYDETGNRKQKTIKSALKTEVFKIENNKELIVSLTENVKGVEQVTNFEYNDDRQLIYKETRLNQNETTDEKYTYQDGRLTQRTIHYQRKSKYFTREKTLTLNCGENGKYTSGHIMECYNPNDGPREDSNISESEIKFDKNGNFYGYAPDGLTLKDLFKRLGIEKGTPIYDKFIELNKDGIKSYNGGRVKTFEVGGIIKFPEEFISKIGDLTEYINCSPQEEKERYTTRLHEKLDIFGYQTTSKLLEKDSSWWEIAKQNLIDMGNKNPSILEITNNTNLLIVLNNAEWNPNEIVKKGTQIEVRSNVGDLKQEFVIDNYRLENLRKMYPADKYKITRKNIAPETDEYMNTVRPVYSYTVTDKAAGKTKLTVTPKFDEYGGMANYNVEEYDDKTGYVIRTLTLPTQINEYSKIVEVKEGKTRVYNEKGVLQTESYKDKNGNNITIKIQNSTEKSITAEDSKGLWLYTIDYKNDKPTKKTDNKGIHYFNKNGSYICTIKYEKGGSTVSSPIADNIMKYMETKDSKQFIENLNMIDFEHAPFIFAAYKKIAENGDLISDIKSSDLDNKTKQYATAYLNKFIKQYTTTNFTNKESCVQNNNYRGVNFTVNLDGTEINIKNSAGETSSIEFANLLKNTTAYEHAALKKTISELPGEVLWDLSKECSRINVNSNPRTIKGSDFREAGHYSAIFDDITIIDEGLYNFPNILFKGTNKSFNTTTLRETVIHEIGHAIDFNGYFNNSASSENSFKDTFEQELKGYLAAGKIQFKYESGFVEDFDVETRESNTCYATANEKEMFAECYTLLMNGDCKSKEHIEKYFPKTLQAAKALLQEIRNKNDFERHSPISKLKFEFS